MKRLRVGILDLVAKAPNRSLYARINYANLASIMPQVIGVWAERDGHDVTYVCYTGYEDLVEELPDDLDVLFVGAFSQAAQLSYALSHLFRSRGAVTVLGGPHARSYPDDARKYFDYVLGFTDEAVIREVLEEHAAHRPLGRHVKADRQPAYLPGVRERWKFIAATLAKSPTNLKGVPMLASLGCPYTCSFCIDSVVKYQPMGAEQIREDLVFLAERMPKAWGAWHDPNFGVRFDDHMNAIEEGNAARSLSFVCESSLSLLPEERLARLKAAGFRALLPGIESWYTLGNKAKTGATTGMEKVVRISEHVNLMLRYVPYVQTNFVLGLDEDSGEEPFELTKRFIDRTPGTFPGYSLLSAYGEAAPLNRDLQAAGRVIPFPFHFLNNNQAMNVRPKNYDWVTFYGHVIELTRYSFSWKNIARRATGTRLGFSTWMNVVRAISSEGFGRIRYFTAVREALQHDRAMRAFFEGESLEVPSFYVDRVRSDLGPLWEWLPEGALEHDANAYLKKSAAVVAGPEASARGARPERAAGAAGAGGGNGAASGSNPGATTPERGSDSNGYGADGKSAASAESLSGVPSEGTSE